MTFGIVGETLAYETKKTSTGTSNWPQFRGPSGSGLGTGQPPTSWNVETGENIQWKTEIPGLGHSSPIVFGEKIFLTTAVSENVDDAALETGWMGGSGTSTKDTGSWTWKVLCLDHKSGNILWEKEVAQGKPKMERHLKASHANCTPATDGKHLLAFFGSEGLYCLDYEGNLLWEKDFGILRAGSYRSDVSWGFSSSPIIHDGKAIIQCDCTNTGFIAILDIQNGKELMRIERNEVAAWSTPTIVEYSGKTQIVCNGYQEMAGYDFQTGERLWTLSGGGDIPVPTPLYAHNLIFITNGHSRSPLYVISPDAKGDLTPNKGPTERQKTKGEEQSKDMKQGPPLKERPKNELPEGLAWWQETGGSYMPTPLIVGDLLYLCNDNGILSVIDAKTGNQIYKKRVSRKSGTYSASAVATEGNVYFGNEQGSVTVIETGEKYKLVATNEMNEVLMATPAIFGDRILIRTVGHLYSIGQ